MAAALQGLREAVCAAALVNETDADSCALKRDEFATATPWHFRILL